MWGFPQFWPESDGKLECRGRRGIVAALDLRRLVVALYASRMKRRPHGWQMHAAVGEETFREDAQHNAVSHSAARLPSIMG
jgi:hypothetical protein